MLEPGKTSATLYHSIALFRFGGLKLYSMCTKSVYKYVQSVIVSDLLLQVSQNAAVGNQDPLHLTGSFRGTIWDPISRWCVYISRQIDENDEDGRFLHESRPSRLLAVASLLHF